MKIPLEARTRKLLLVGLSVLVVAGALAYNLADGDTLPEQIENLHQIKPYDLAALGLETWEVKGSTTPSMPARVGLAGSPSGYWRPRIKLDPGSLVHAPR